MLIEIDVKVADDGMFHNWLDRILHKIDDGWHVWDTSSTVDSQGLRKILVDSRPREPRRLGS